MKKGAGRDAVAKEGSRSKPGIFAMIAKNSLGLAKFTVASEISHFRYLCGISLG